jgi:hypothetical protein
VIDALEDEDYAAFEMAITAEFDAQSSVERELVLRLASLLWPLRRATAIESGLFEIQAQLLQFRQRQGQKDRQETVEAPCRNTISLDAGAQLQEHNNSGDSSSASATVSKFDFDGLTRTFLRLSNLPTYPLDRLSRYEATLWRQACQILFALRFWERRKPWERMRPRIR